MPFSFCDLRNIQNHFHMAEQGSEETAQGSCASADTTDSVEIKTPLQVRRVFHWYRLFRRRIVFSTFAPANQAGSRDDSRTDQRKDCEHRDESADS